MTVRENKPKLRETDGRSIGRPFTPGNGGRPKRARNKLAENFLADMLADWEKHGVAAIEHVRENDTTQYLKVVAGILPKELNVKVNDFDDLTDDQLARQFAAIASQLARAGVGIGEGIDAEASAEQTGEIQTIQ